MIVWLNPTAGLSGDMLLGALLELGAPLEGVRRSVASTGITGWHIDAATATRAGLRATKASVVVTDDAADRSAAVLLELVSRAQPNAVADIARRAVQLLAEVEAGIHGVAVADVHLHELGGVDTVADIVGVAAAVVALDITELWSAPLRLGAGTVNTAHGVLPVPAPATLALLQGVPVVGVDLVGETVTPTGAVLLKALGCRFGPMPAMTIRGVGYGAGSRDTRSGPNVLPAVLGEGIDGSAGRQEAMTVLETTVDDVTGEVLGHLIDQLLTDGAVDAWISPVVGKKSRPAHVITALTDAVNAPAVEATILRETGSLGIRSSTVIRRALPRSEGVVTVLGHTVRMKAGPYRVKPEHRDVVAVSAATGWSVRAVAERAMSAWPQPADTEAGNSAC